MRKLIRNIQLKVQVAVVATALVVLAGVKTVLEPNKPPRYEPYGPNHRCHDMERHHTDLCGNCNNCKCKP
jgi:hypothetical protein